MEPTTPTTEQLTASRQIFRGDWDSYGTVSVHLPARAAKPLLLALGWEFQPNGRWNAPDGLSFSWDAEEALSIALLAATL